MACMNPVLCYIDQEKGNRRFINWEFAVRHIYSDYILNNNIPFDCLKCYFCRKKNAYNLAVRCVLHASLYKDNCFLTLTYDEEKDGYENKLDYTHIQKFKKKLRRHCDPKKIEIFNVHEFGKNGKKHWHLVVFNHDFQDKEYLFTKNGNNLYTSEKLKKLWGFGHVTIGDVTEASAMYQSQYTMKDIKNGNENSEKKAKSNHSGIGLPYFMRHYRQILCLGYVPFGNTKIPVPRSFQRRAHKHYCHFYEPHYFHDTVDRKRWYTPMHDDDAIKELAESYIVFKQHKSSFIEELEKNWSDVIEKFIESEEKPDFIKSAENALYDLRNKNNSSSELF